MSENMFRAIVQLQAEYCRAIDDNQLEAWPSFFTDDCLYRVTSAANHAAGYEAGIMSAFSRGMLDDRVSALRDANIYERHSYRHVIGQPAIEEESEEGARAVTSFLVLRIMRDGTTDIFATGRYLDHFTRVDGTLRIAERIVVCDSSRIHTLLALPL
jgi:anthranilate 1,2-dioxygenase small subunit